MERSNATAAEDAILGFLQSKEEISNSGDFASSLGIDHDVIVNAIKSLHGFEFVVARDIKKERWVLTDEGKSYAVSGSPEVQFFLAVPLEGISHEQLQKQVDPAVYKIGRSQATKNKWVEMGKTNVSRKVEHVEDRVKDLLQRVHDGKVIDTKDIEDLKKRKLITLQTWKGYSLQKGPNYAPKRVKAATDLTREHLQRLEERGVIYTRVMGAGFDLSSPGGRGWQTFSTQDKTKAEQRAAQLGVKLEWMEEGVKLGAGPIEAIRTDKTRGRQVWFNNVVTYFTSGEDSHNDPQKTVFFGDGKPLPPDTVFDCQKILDEECVAMPWQKGDILLLDNWAVLHARQSFEPPRRILVSLCVNRPEP